jgi:hypothetical protein
MTIKQRLEKLEQIRDSGYTPLPVWRDDFTPEELEDFCNQFI